MGQAVMERKRAAFFERLPQSIEGYEGRIDLLLSVLTEQQLDEVMYCLDTDPTVCPDCGETLTLHGNPDDAGGLWVCPGCDWTGGA